MEHGVVGGGGRAEGGGRGQNGIAVRKKMKNSFRGSDHQQAPPRYVVMSGN